ncbi:hypothetical protein CTZ28_22245 [Streptomyces shenzhenensis]|uniref:Insertion element IS150 protein InsJ-like helix-turn-helix domain-containing protein n=1 Tax=Streptomyces shenzhenensis TaxID=943815 RepID=A0A3M0I6D1_9ACTN|nr:hypothetical protein CTZ28_22245 [Streptomyces shenzhenensis]
MPRHILDVAVSLTLTWQEQANRSRWMAEHRYREALQMLDGVPVTEVARRFGVSRQSIHTWAERYHTGGPGGLVARSRSPHTSPHQVAGEAEAPVCELRRAYPRWGARRIRPMQLWQLDLMGGVFLASGRECKLVTGIDDHSRFIVIAKVVAEAMTTYGVPSDVLTDHGKAVHRPLCSARPRSRTSSTRSICPNRRMSRPAVVAELLAPQLPSPTSEPSSSRWSSRRSAGSACPTNQQLKFPAASSDATAISASAARRTRPRSTWPDSPSPSASAAG